MTSKQKVYVTTSIPYVNSRPHIGHALELIQADVLARYYRLHGASVVFQTGTDENAFKNVLAARQLGITTEELVDKNSGIFRSLAEKLNLSADTFIRTTEERHKRGVIKFWNRIKPDDLYTKRYEGLYCIGCEDFYLERDLVNGCCPDHAVPPTRTEEENIFFRLSSYQSELDRLISSDQIRIVPIQRKNEVLSFIRRGLQDISISRSIERSGGWGIPVPENPSQVVYVWIDALINYVSGQGFGTDSEWESVWNQDTKKIHVIGKNVWKFHAVYWPALLLSVGLPLPNDLFVHGFLTENGRKISKSLGNTIDPFEYIEQFGVDGLRHYLTKAVSPFEDGDFSTTRIGQTYQSDLANGLGNLLSRVTSLCAKAGYGDGLAIKKTNPQIPNIETALKDYRLNDAAQCVWQEVDRLNDDIARVKPWELLKADRSEELQVVLRRWLEGICLVAFGLKPFLPDASRRLLDTVTATPITASSALFPRKDE